MNTRQKITGVVFIVIAVVLFVYVLYYNSTKRHIPIVFSPSSMLQSLWRDYKDEYIEPQSGRTLDTERNNITTSEAQSYTMLRAVWMDDRETFDKSWSFTKNNLQHDEDALFSWLYGERSDGSFGILTDRGGQNAASDADTDIA